MLPIGGQGEGEPFGAVDVEGDGRDELYAGGTTVNSFIANLVVLVDGQLREVRPPPGVRFLLENGPELRATDQPSRGFACEDIDGDGLRELLALTGRTHGNRVAWTRVAYRIKGTQAKVVDTAEGVYRSPQDDALMQGLMSGTCGLTTISGGG